MGNSALPWVEAAQSQAAAAPPPATAALPPWEEAAKSGTSVSQSQSQVTMGPARPEPLWDTIKKWALHPFDSLADATAVAPSESGTARARVHEVAQNAGQLADVYSEEGGLLSAPKALTEIPAAFGDALDAYRTARAAKLAQDTDEWQKINDVLGVPKSGIRISPSSTSIEDAATMPGRTVAGLGYTAKALDGMEPIERMNFLDSHLQAAGQAIQNAASAATKSGKVLNVGDSAMDVFKSIKDPAMQEKMIDQFNSTAKELGITNLRQATPEQALALRQALRAGKSFSGFSDIQTVANISKQLGGAVSSDLKEAVPDFSQLDEAYSDLRGARDAALGTVKSALSTAPRPGMIVRVGQNIGKEFARNPVRTAAYALGGAGGAIYGIDRALRGVGSQ